MKIAYCINDHSGGGGTERIISRKCNKLIEAGYEICIIDTFKSNCESVFNFSKEIDYYNLEIDYFKVRNYNLLIKLFLYPLLYILHAIKLRRILKKINPDILISTFGHEARIIPCLKHPCKRILEFHHTRGYKLIELSHRELSSLQKMLIQYNEQREEKLINKFDTFVVLTEEDKQAWNNPSHCIVIPNMNSFSTLKYANTMQKQVLAMGRLTYLKGFDILLKVWKQVSEIIPDWHLNISGEGEEKINLQKQIEELNLGNNVSILPFTQDALSRYLEHSIFVLSSRHEGFGLVLTEAMECGIPCVSFRCKSGPSEIINDSIDGYLVTEQNIDEMAKKIIYLATNDQIRGMMGKKAKENVKRFAEDLIILKWTSLFNNLLSK